MKKIRIPNDLDGIINSFGAIIEVRTTANETNVSVVTNDGMLIITSLDEYSSLPTFIKAINSIGFEVEYAKAREYSEILEDMKNNSKDWSHSERFFYIQHIPGKRFLSSLKGSQDTQIMGEMLFTKEDVIRFTTELNESVYNVFL